MVRDPTHITGYMSKAQLSKSARIGAALYTGVCGFLDLDAGAAAKQGPELRVLIDDLADQHLVLLTNNEMCTPSPSS